MKYLVADSVEIVSGKMLEKNVNGEVLIFFRFQGEIKAYAGICPHQGARLANGIIQEDAIVCPLHNRTYHCKNGYDKKYHTVLKEYPVSEENGKVYVEIKEEKTVAVAEFKRRTIKDLPQPKGHFLTGNLKEFTTGNKPRVLEKWAKEYGSIYRISLMGKKFIVSTDPDFNIQLYKSRPDKFRRFGKIDDVMTEMGIKGVFNAEGEEWKIHRKFAAEALNSRNVTGFFPVLKDVTERLRNRWNNQETLQAVDIQKEMMLYTVDITTRIAFGYETNSIEKDDDILQQHLERIFPVINKRITSPFPFWRIWPSKTDKELNTSLKELKEAIGIFITEAKEKLKNNPSLKENPSNFLQALIVEKEKGGIFTDEEIYGNVFILLLAGEDTTSNSISWCLYYLSQNPRLYSRLQEEADNVLGNHPCVQNAEMLNKLVFTEALAMETLRLQPVTPTLFLESLEDQEINGLEIKKGVTVMMQSRVAQNSEEHFTRANEFLPDRWLENTSCPVHNTDVFRTFGAGPRFCPGKTLAMHEMKMALSMIARNFDIELAVKPEDVKEKFAFTLFPENLLLKINKRKTTEKHRSVVLDSEANVS